MNYWYFCMLVIFVVGIAILPIMLICFLYDLFKNKKYVPIIKEYKVLCIRKVKNIFYFDLLNENNEIVFESLNRYRTEFSILIGNENKFIVTQTRHYDNYYNTSYKLVLTKETYFDLKQKGEIKL